MTISWANSDGQTGIADDAYEFAMQHSEQPKKIVDINEQNMFPTHHGEATLPPEAFDTKIPFDQSLRAYSKGVDDFAAEKGMRPEDTFSVTDPDRGNILYKYLGPDKQKHGAEFNFMEVKPVVPSDKVSGKGFHEQLAAFQQRLDTTPPAEASELQKFFGSLNIMPRPGKPQEEWTVKEHLGYMLNTAMAGMGGGFKAPTPMTRLFRAETSTLPREKPAPIADWQMEDPTIQGMLKATGRWFTNSKETAQWYQDKMGGKGISFVDVPTSEVQQHLAARNPEAARFTAAGREKEEYFLPSDIAAKRKLLSSIIPEKTVNTPLQEQLATYETLSSQGKTTKQIVKGTKLAPEQVREALGRDNLAIAAFNSENSLTNAYFKSLEKLDPALGEALKKQVSVKDLKRYTRGLPEEQLKTIFEELPSHVKEAFESGEQRRMNIDAGKKSKVIPKPLK